MPSKQASDGNRSEGRIRAAGNARDEQEAHQGEVEVFGDQTTNVIMLALTVLAWLSQYANVSNCTC